MILLSVRQLCRQFDAEPVFRDVTFDVRTGEKIGLVGPNGTGKTTLLRIIAGLDEPDSGQVNRHPAGDVALLEQSADFPAGRTLVEEAKAGLARLYRLQSEAAELADQIAAESDIAASTPDIRSVRGTGGPNAGRLKRLTRQYDRLQEELQSRRAYNIDHRVDEVLAGLGFSTEHYDRLLHEFSGGEQSRALLARMLLRRPALMLLDEPTNHLDIAATEWLESFLARSDEAMLIVSHDRYFLDRVTGRTLELHGGRLTDYSGNFSAYWTLREERHKTLRRTYDKQQEEIARTEDFIRRNKYGQKHAQAADREKKLARMTPVEWQQDFSEVSMNFGQAARSGDWVIDAVGVAKGFGTPLVRDFTLRVGRGDRIGILGPNGSGKTTLLRTLLGELEPDEGTVRLGTGVKVGYFDQQLESLRSGVDAVEAVRPPDALDVTPGTLRNLLARFGIRGELALQNVDRMSGGEKSKVALARLAAQNVNLLALDEPTNHLDLWARGSLEVALDRFEGTLLFVSHDRYFLDRVAKAVIVLEPDRWRFHEGSYSDYVTFVRSQGFSEFPGISHDAANAPGAGASNQGTEQAGAEQAAGSRDGKPVRKRKFPYRKVRDLEREIADREEQLAQLEDDLANPRNHPDGQRMTEIAAEYDQAKTRLEALYEHWEEAVELN